MLVDIGNNKVHNTFSSLAPARTQHRPRHAAQLFAVSPTDILLGEAHVRTAQPGCPAAVIPVVFDSDDDDDRVAKSGSSATSGRNGSGGGINHTALARPKAPQRPPQSSTRRATHHSHRRRSRRRGAQVRPRHTTAPRHTSTIESAHKLAAWHDPRGRPASSPLYRDVKPRDGRRGSDGDVERDAGAYVNVSDPAPHEAVPRQRSGHYKRDGSHRGLRSSNHHHYNNNNSNSYSYKLAQGAPSSRLRVGGDSHADYSAPPVHSLSGEGDDVGSDANVRGRGRDGAERVTLERPPYARGPTPLADAADGDWRRNGAVVALVPPSASTRAVVEVEVGVTKVHQPSGGTSQPRPRPTVDAALGTPMQNLVAVEEPERDARPHPGPQLAQTKIQLGVQLKRWVILSRIGAGSFGETFTAVEVSWPPPPDDSLSITPEAAALLEHPPPVETRHEVCIKVEQENKNVLRLEALALKKVQPCPQVVRYYASGCTAGMNYLVMEKLGPNLADLRRRSPHGTFNIYTTLKAGISCLRAIRGVHEQGLVHRDIKPSNFVTGLPGTAAQATCYLIDFGLARRFRRSSGTIRPARANAGFRGTSRYASVASHRHCELGRVDDLWSLLFMLVEFATGSLPWRKYKDKEAIGRCKEESISPYLVRNLPREFQPFLTHLTTLSYEDEPNYDYLLQLMQSAVTRRGYAADKLVDWELDPSTLEATAEAEWHAAPRPLSAAKSRPALDGPAASSAAPRDDVGVVVAALPRKRVPTAAVVTTPVVNDNAAAGSAPAVGGAARVEELDVAHRPDVPATVAQAAVVDAAEGVGATTMMGCAAAAAVPETPKASTAGEEEEVEIVEAAEMSTDLFSPREAERAPRPLHDVLLSPPIPYRESTPEMDAVRGPVTGPAHPVAVQSTAHGTACGDVAAAQTQPAPSQPPASPGKTRRKTKTIHCDCCLM